MIKDLKSLEKAIKICRKLGVSTIKIGDVEFVLDKVHSKPRFTLGEFGENVKVPTPNIPVDENDRIVTEELTQEQLLHWSVSDQPN